MAWGVRVRAFVSLVCVLSMVSVKTISSPKQRTLKASHTHVPKRQSHQEFMQFNARKLRFKCRPLLWQASGAESEWVNYLLKYNLIVLVGKKEHRMKMCSPPSVPESISGAAWFVCAEDLLLGECLGKHCDWLQAVILNHEHRLHRRNVGANSLLILKIYSQFRDAYRFVLYNL